MTNPNRSTSFLARFWAKVHEGDASECWEWLATRSSWGYGNFGLGDRGGPITASRLAWMLGNAMPVPSGLCVLHSCDNAACCNPSHLHLGTLSDNAREARERGRMLLPTERGYLGWQAYKTLCKRGHPLSGDNLLVERCGKRQCRICNKMRALRKNDHRRNRGTEPASSRS